MQLFNFKEIAFLSEKGWKIESTGLERGELKRQKYKPYLFPSELTKGKRLPTLTAPTPTMECLFCCC